jgi:hypothetical protein
VQELYPDDFPKRAISLVNTFDDGLLEKTFFSDEAWFHLSGYVNSQNMRIWSTKNLHVYVEAPCIRKKLAFGQQFLNDG